MRIVLALIAACVLAGTLAGYLVGRSTSEGPIFEALLSNVDVMHGANDKFTFNYVCNGKVLASYDVDTKQLVSARLTDDEFQELQKVWSLNNKKGLYQRTYDVVLGFVTGGGAVRFARPLFTIVRSRQANQYTIPSMLGALSGFYLGYGIATRKIPSCDSPFPLLLSQRAATWKFLEKDVAHKYFLQMMTRAFFAKSEEPEALAGAALQRIGNGQVDSQTLLILSSIAKFAPEEAPFSWFSFDLILGVYIPAFVLLCVAVGAAVLLVSRDARLASARNAKAAANEAKETAEKLRAAVKRKKDQ